MKKLIPLLFVCVNAYAMPTFDFYHDQPTAVMKATCETELPEINHVNVEFEDGLAAAAVYPALEFYCPFILAYDNYALSMNSSGFKIAFKQETDKEWQHTFINAYQQDGIVQITEYNSEHQYKTVNTHNVLMNVRATILNAL